MLTTHTLAKVSSVPLNKWKNDHDDNSQAAEQEHANQLRLPLPRNLQPPQHRHRYAQRHDISKGIESANDDVRCVNADARRVRNRGIPSSANGSALDQQHEELGRAVADDEGADGPEDNEQTGAGEDASVEDEDGDFGQGDGGIVEDEVCEDDLVG